MLNVLWVILQRWDGLQEYARASNIAWPLPTAKQDALVDSAEQAVYF